MSFISAFSKSGESKPAKARKASDVMSHQEERAATQLARDHTKRERFELYHKVNLALSFALILTTASTVYLSLQPAEIRFVTLGPNGEVGSIEPTVRPTPSQVEVATFVSKAVATAMTVNHAQYEDQLGQARLAFTDSGWQGFRAALERTGLLSRIISQKLTSTAVPSNAPLVKWSGELKTGNWGWQVEIPMVVRYKSLSSEQTGNYLVEVIVTARPESESITGLGIESFNIKG